MTETSDISVVVQGPIVGRPGDRASARLTARCLASIRRHLPDAELVLSTWRGSDVTALSFDRLIENDDPGGMRCDDWPHNRAPVPMPYNANRQIVSTREGLRAASRSLVVKIRSDMVLTGTGFRRYFGRYVARAPEWKLLRQRVVVPNWWSRDPRAPHGMAYNPSDWFQYGLREDLLALWDVPLTDAEMPMWFAARPRPPEYADTETHYRYTVEQYIWLAFLRKYRDVPLEHKFVVAPDTVRHSELTIANNLVIADIAALDIQFLKYKASFADWGTLYTHGEWQRLYREYCDPAFDPGADAITVGKRAYNALLRPTHRVLMSPRASRIGRVVSSAWERQHPRSFRAMKRAYLAGWSAIGRAVWRRA